MHWRGSLGVPSLTYAVLKDFAKQNLFKDLYFPVDPASPWCIWARSNIENYSWLYRYLLGIAAEFDRRLGKIHGVTKVLRVLDTIRRPPEDTPIGSIMSGMPTVVGPNDLYLPENEILRGPYWWAGVEDLEVRLNPELIIDLLANNFYFFKGERMIASSSREEAPLRYRYYYAKSKWPICKWTGERESAMPSWFREYHEHRGGKFVIQDSPRIKGKKEMRIVYA
jgi:hypothetical protein